MAELQGLPGVRPLDPAQWLHVDDAYAGQMARREALLAERPDDVIAQVAGSSAAQVEALQLVLQALAELPGFERHGRMMHCPDGRRVALDDPPLRVMGRLIQEDICILEKPVGAPEHVLTAAVLCFPASWRLSEKMGHPLRAIHAPVTEYNEGLAKRVQRLFDGVKQDRPLWRFNRLWYTDPELHQPRSASTRREYPVDTSTSCLRSERQCILRLPKSRAVVFSVHTYVLRAEVARSQIDQS